MLGIKFARLIEKHSESLGKTLVDKLRNSGRTDSFRSISEHELLHDVQVLYRNLSDWLMTRTEFDIQEYYTKVGMRRAEQGRPNQPVCMGAGAGQGTVVAVYAAGGDGRRRAGVGERTGVRAGARTILRSRSVLRSGGLHTRQEKYCGSLICAIPAGRAEPICAAAARVGEAGVPVLLHRKNQKCGRRLPHSRNVMLFAGLAVAFFHSRKSSP